MSASIEQTSPAIFPLTFPILFQTMDRYSRRMRRRRRYGAMAMAEPPERDPAFDALDAFFSAADSDDPGAMEQAAESVVKPAAPQPAAAAAQPPKKKKAAPPPKQQVPDAPESLEGKFIAIDPDAIEQEAGAPRHEPFVLIPAHIHSFLPWWVWVAIIISLALLVCGIMLMPGVTLERMTARLESTDNASVQSAMRQLVLKGDERTVNKLFDIASSNEQGITMRLRAVDTLSLIEANEADRALLRLELGGNTEAQVREAAIAARKQRKASQTRPRGR